MAAAASAILLLAGTAAADPLLAAAGDIACTPGATSDGTHCQQLQTANLALASHPDAVAILGDNQYESGSLAEFTGSFDPTWGRFRSLIRPVPGNHEYQTAGAAGYFGYFGAAAGSSSTPYYSYDLGKWHLLALNSNCGDAPSECGNFLKGRVSSDEVAWLESDLNAHPGVCTLAYWHHPLFGSGSVGSSPRVQLLWNVLFQHRGDVVLNGHQHDYERFGLQNPVGQATPLGLREFVVGTGGDDHHLVSGSRAANSQFYDGDDFGVLLLRLHESSYDWAFERVDGVALDSGSSPCHSQARLRMILASRSITVRGSSALVPVRCQPASRERGAGALLLSWHVGGAGNGRLRALARRSFSIQCGSPKVVAMKLPSDALRSLRRRPGHGLPVMVSLVAAPTQIRPTTPRRPAVLRLAAVPRA
jgi:hypothetical protein